MAATPSLPLGKSMISIGIPPGGWGVGGGSKFGKLSGNNDNHPSNLATRSLVKHFNRLHKAGWRRVGVVQACIVL